MPGRDATKNVNASPLRLNLVLTPPNPIYFEKNYNGGGDVAKESGKDAHTAHITVYHDAQHPSALELPVLQK